MEKKQHIIRVAQSISKFGKRWSHPNLILALHIYPLMLESKVITKKQKNKNI
jgi:hypothetical protein